MTSTTTTDKDDDFRCEQASATGGLRFDDPEEGEMLRRSLMYLAQRVGGQVLAGNINFTRMSMPVYMNEPRSLLERITDDWAYAPHYLPKAAQSTNPIDRIKYVAAFVVSGLHCIHTLGKPFNPILGSTYQTCLADGTPCYVEQTSHHPPVTHYLIQPKSADYVFAGFSGIDGRIVWGLETSLSSRRIGINVVQFKDGSRIVYNLPRMLVKGLGAERKCEFVGPFSVFYEDHGLVFDFVIDPPKPFAWSPFRARTPSDYLDGVLYRINKNVDPHEKDVIFTGAFKKEENAFFGNPDAAKAEADAGGYTAIELRQDRQVTDSVTIAIRERDGANVQHPFEREILGYAKGTYVGYLDIDGDRIWDIRDTPKSETKTTDADDALLSDCRHREDVHVLKRALAEQDEQKKAELIDEAQLLKEKLENIQREDRKLRKAGLVDETENSEDADNTVNQRESEEKVIEDKGDESKVEEEQPKDNGSSNSTENDEENDSEDEEPAEEMPEQKEEEPFFPKSLGGL